MVGMNPAIMCRSCYLFAIDTSGLDSSSSEDNSIPSIRQLKNHFHVTPHKYIFCILLYSGISTYTYEELYGSGLFNFGSYINLLTLFAYFLGFDIPTSFIFIKIILVNLLENS